MATKGRYFQLNYPKRICLQQMILMSLLENILNKILPGRQIFIGDVQ